MNFFDELYRATNTSTIAGIGALSIGALRTSPVAICRPVSEGVTVGALRTHAFRIGALSEGVSVSVLSTHALRIGALSTSIAMSTSASS